MSASWSLWKGLNPSQTSSYSSCSSSSPGVWGRTGGIVAAAIDIVIVEKESKSGVRVRNCEIRLRLEAATFRQQNQVRVDMNRRR